MKTKSLLLSLVFLLSLGAGVSAQETTLPEAGLPAVASAEAGLTSDSLFYFLETITEGIGTFFTFGDIKKAERYANLATERLAEAKALVEKEKPELAEKTLARYEKQLNNSIAHAEKTQTKNESNEKAIEVMTRVRMTTAAHLEILAEIHEKVPEQAKPAIEKAMGASVKGHEKAVSMLKEKNALGEAPERVSMPAEIPQEVQERIQMKVQQELMVEKALQVSELPRDMCTRMGGPSETCEKIPPEGFKSFEELKDFCTSSGGPSEICASLESKCKELGVTKPDDCFRVISTATLETYNSVELKTRPVPPMTEEETKERRRMEEEAKINIIEINGSKDKLTKCESSEVIFYFSPGCGYCEKVKSDGTISKMEELGIKVTQVNVQIEPVEHEFRGVPTFVIKEQVHVGYKTFKQLSELLGCS